MSMCSRSEPPMNQEHLQLVLRSVSSSLEAVEQKEVKIIVWNLCGIKHEH